MYAEKRTSNNKTDRENNSRERKIFAISQLGLTVGKINRLKYYFIFLHATKFYSSSTIVVAILRRIY